MQNNTLPKTLHVSEPSRAVDWKSAKLELVLANRAWLPNDSRIRRASVSAFGIGGTNAHVIVEESPRPVREEIGNIRPSVFPVAVPSVLSGNSYRALRAQAEKLRSHIESGVGKDNRLSDVAYSVVTSRTHLHQRLVMTAGGKAQMLEKLAFVSSGSGKLLILNEVGKASLGMLFPGHGSQHRGIGKDLYAVFPLLRETLDEIAARFTDLEAPLLDIVWAEPEGASASLLNCTDFAQQALFALEVFFWRLWQWWGVRPDFSLGHRVRELAVAHVARILDLPDACRLVIISGRLMQALHCHGKMASLAASSAEVARAIRALSQSDKVEIAGYNMHRRC